MIKKKVLHIAQSGGGVSEYLKMYFKYSDREIYDNELLCSESYLNEIEEYEKLGVYPNIINMNRDINILQDFKSLINVYSKIKEIKPDIIYCHSSKAGFIGRIPAVLLGIPVIYNAHGWAFNMRTHKIKRIIYAFIEKTLAIFSTKIIAISEDEYNSALSWKICSSKKLVLIKNCIDIRNSKVEISKEEILNELNLNKNDLIIGMVGRVSEQKGPKTFVKIAKKISKIYKNVHFLYIGDGELRDEIEELIASENLQDKVTITGWKKKVLNYINVFDIALLTSNWEGFGLVILEYMLMKKPVIASNVGGIKNIIKNNETGILVPTGDVDKFSNEIIRLIKNKKLVKYISSNGEYYVKNNHDIVKLVLEHEKLISEIIQGRKIHEN